MFCLFSESNVPTLHPYNKDGLEIVFSLHKVPDSNSLTINVTAKNNTLSNMTEFLFQVAVPRVSIFYRFNNCTCLMLVYSFNAIFASVTVLALIIFRYSLFKIQMVLFVFGGSPMFENYVYFLTN